MNSEEFAIDFYNLQPVTRNPYPVTQVLQGILGYF